MRTMKMWCVTIRIKKNDTVKGKRVHNVILDLLKKGNISGATVWTGVAGFGKRGKSNFEIEGISINMPLLIEVIDELPKLEAILPEIKEVIGDNGLVTLHEVGVV
jgi:PII-like signaling protein